MSANGSLTVSPVHTTTYTLTATGTGGTPKAGTGVYVGNTGEYAYGDPTPAEQAHLEAINHARLNPEAEALRLGIDLNEGLPPGTISAEPKQPLAFNARILLAARLHSMDMIDQQYFSHDSIDERTFEDRINEIGYDVAFPGENIAYDTSHDPLDEINTVLGFHDTFFIDEGFEGRGHRSNILNNNYKEIGLGTAPGSCWEYPYCYMFTCDFAASSWDSGPFLLGVVYDDQNSDGIYTAGEGISNVDIVITGSGDQTYTASAGGYALPLFPGNYTVKATLPDGSYEATRQITIADRNVKVDFQLRDFDFVPPTVSISASPQLIGLGGASTLSWASTNADSASIDQGIGSVSIDGSTTVSPAATTTYTITVIGPGGSDSAAVTVEYEPLLTVRVISPQDGAVLYSSHVTVCGQVNYNTSTVTVNGLYALVSNGAFTAEEVTLGEGENTIAAIAQKQAETATNTITVTYVVDNTPPNIEITSPLDAATVTTPTITISGAIDDLSAFVTVNGADATTENGVFTARINLVAGSNTITAVATDLAQNEGTNIITVTLDTNVATLTGTVADAITGDPLEGVNVTVIDTSMTQTDMTGITGEFTIAGITLGPVEITATLAGYVKKSVQTNFPANEIYALDIVLYSVSATATVNGIITNAKTLQPEPHVDITVEGYEISGMTGPDGIFTLTEVPMGTQSFKVFKEDFVKNTITVDITEDPYQLDLVFPNINGVAYPAEIDTTFNGIVYDAVTGRTLEGAVIKVFGLDLSTTSGAEGEFTLSGLPPGPRPLIAMAPDYEAVIMRPTVVPGADDTFDFHLPPMTKGLITGIVTDIDTGEPIRYATIEVEEDGLLASCSEADGTYQLVGVPAGTYNVTITHPEYLSTLSNNIVVFDQMPATLDITLNRRPETGSLEGAITDKDTGDPVVGAILQAEGTVITGSTDSTGYYHLSGLPSGLVTLAINAAGYSPTIRTTAVVADKDYSITTTTAADFKLNAGDSTPPDSISELITATDGGTIESPDRRFMLVIPPGALSNDAIVTLMAPGDGPTVSSGDELTVDPELGLSDIKAIGRMTQVVVEPAAPEDEIPTVQGWILVSGRYFEAEVDEFEIAENSIFPYYWDGTNWTVMRIKPYESAVDRINNLSLSVVDISTTETGNLITGQLGSRTPIMLASLDDHIPNLGLAIKYLYMLGGKLLLPTSDPAPNVTIYDKEDLRESTEDNNHDPVMPAEGSDTHPNPNALPVMVVSGWNPLSTLFNVEGDNPNFPKTGSSRYYYMLKDLLDATNGVYRTLFVASNSRAGMVSIANDMVGKYKAENICGMPVPDDDKSGKFPYIDALGFSMGGLIVRNYQVFTRDIHNGVIIGTPNHGTFEFLDNFPFLYVLGFLPEEIKHWSPGTADLLAYDDRKSPFWSGNPRLHRLNTNPAGIPRADLSLIAGTDSGLLGGLYLPLPNDMIVPLESVFFRTSDPDDEEWRSLVEIERPNKKYEYGFGFNHFNFGDKDFRIKDNVEVKDAILHGLSDWVVAELIQSQVAGHPDSNYVQYAEFEVEVQYNVFEENDSEVREYRDYNCVVLVIYGQDENDQWHIAGYADAEGDITYSVPIQGNSQNIADPLTPSANIYYPEETQIKRVEFAFMPWKRTPDGRHIPPKVPLEPDPNFGLPQ